MKSEARSVGLREIAADESSEVEAMARQIWPTAYSNIISHEQIDFMLGWMYSPEKIADEIVNGGIRYFWVESNDENVGFLAVGPDFTSERAHLHKCYLLCEKHGRGIGSQVLGMLIDSLKNTGVAELELRVNRDNSAAIGFYEKNGFRTVAEDKADIGNGFAMDDFIMRRRL